MDYLCPVEMKSDRGIHLSDPFLLMCVYVSYSLEIFAVFLFLTGTVQDKAQRKTFEHRGYRVHESVQLALDRKRAW